MNNAHQREGTDHAHRSTTGGPVCPAPTLRLWQALGHGTPWGGWNLWSPCDHHRLPGKYRITHRHREPVGRRSSGRHQLPLAPFVLYHLTKPKGNGFLFFVMDVLLIAFTLITLGASIGAAIQNYHQKGEQRASSFRSPVLTGLITGVAGMLIGAILIAAIAQPWPSGAVSPGTTSTNGVPTVHMSAANFTQPSVTIVKGSRLLLVDDVAVTHILANGSWQHGTAAPAHEPGAPTVNNV